MKLLHIGLGKAASTYLQKEVFPEICKEKKIQFVELSKYIDNNKDFKFHKLEDINNLDHCIGFKDYILSYEGLFSWGWEFKDVDKSFQIIKNNFNKDTTILLILRNPYDFLNSIFVQSIHSMNIVQPKNFFNHYNIDVIRKDNTYSLYKFDYKYLISIYKSYFKKVYVYKYEELHNYKFVRDIFNLDDKFINFLKKKETIKHNKSISSYGVNTILFLSQYVDLLKIRKFIKKREKDTKGFFNKLINKSLKIFFLRELFQNNLDKFLPHRPYKIDKKFIPLDIEKMIEDYNNNNFLR